MTHTPEPDKRGERKLYKVKPRRAYRVNSKVAAQEGEELLLTDAQAKAASYIVDAVGEPLPIGDTGTPPLSDSEVAEALKKAEGAIEEQAKAIDDLQEELKETHAQLTAANKAIEERDETLEQAEARIKELTAPQEDTAPKSAPTDPNGASPGAGGSKKKNAGKPSPSKP